MHSFTTERLLIRPLLAEDEKFFCQQFTNEKVMRYTGGVLSDAEASKAFQRSIRANQRFINSGKKSLLTWAIINVQDSAIIGTQTLSFLIRPHNIDIMNKAKKTGVKQAEIGIMLAPKANGKLVPEEAMCSLIEYAFSNLSLDQINAHFSLRNLATARFTKKIGFVSHSKIIDKEPTQIIQSVYRKNWKQGHIKKIRNNDLKNV